MATDLGSDSLDESAKDADVANLVGVTRRFVTATEPIVAVDDVSVAVPARRLTVIAGSSGSGKSTLLSMISCLDRPDAGTVEIEGHSVQSLSARVRRAVRRYRLGVVLPLPSDNLLEHLDAIGNLAWAARLRTLSTPADDVLHAALADVGLADAATKRVRQLSGGEQQRLALACALIGDPALVVADEPTASLDRTNAATVVDAMRAAADRGVALAVASHDAHVIDAADRLVRLDHGRRVS